MAFKKKVLVLGENKYNCEWLRSVSEGVAIRTLIGGSRDANQIRNAWKQANGLSVRNEETNSATVKPKSKKATKKK